MNSSISSNARAIFAIFCHDIFLSLSSFPVFFFYRCLVKYLRNVCTSKSRDIFIKYILSFHSFSSVSTINWLVHVTDYFVLRKIYTFSFSLSFFPFSSFHYFLFPITFILFSLCMFFLFIYHLSTRVRLCFLLNWTVLTNVFVYLCVVRVHPKSIKCTVNIYRCASQSTNIPKHIVLNIFCHLLRSWNDFRKFNIISDHIDNINVLQIINHIRSI